MKFSPITFSLFSFLVFVIISCQNHSLENQQVKTELYFGMSNSSGEIPESEWISFKREVIENMLGGFTELKGEGYWISETGKKYYEKSVILIYIHEQSEVETNKIDSLISLYKTRFDQESVLQTDQEIDVFFK